MKKYLLIKSEKNGLSSIKIRAEVPLQSKIKIGVMLLFSLFLINFTSSLVINDSHGLAMSDGAIINYSMGVNVTINNAGWNITTVVKPAGSGATRAYLQLMNNTIMVNASFVGNNATINYPVEIGKSYYIITNNNGDNYTYSISTASGAGVNKTNVNYRDGVYCAPNCLSGIGTFRNIESIFTSNGEESGINVNLAYPPNGSAFSTSNQLFQVNLTMTGTNYSYSWNNNTINVWYDNGTSFNTTLSTGLTGNRSNISKTINGFSVGTYLWNSYACYSNSTAMNCTWATNNRTFSVGSTILSLNYSNSTYETAWEDFIASFSLISGSQVSSVQLIYNGTTYSISNTSSSGGVYTVEKHIDIPLNVVSTANQTNEFYIRFTYNGSSVQTFGPYTQNASFINLVQCGGAYLTQALNFTFYDEYTQKNIDASSNRTTLFTSFKYWIGQGSVFKNYSFQNLSSTVNNYTFCIYPYNSNITFRSDMDMNYFADNYEDGKYYLRNSSLNNVSSDILLYLLPSDFATKFFLTFKNGINAISGGVVNVQKYFVGLGQYKTVGILLTDNTGKATMWQQVDETYRYSIVQNNVLLGVIDRVSICTAAPCSMTIMISGDIGSAFQAYDNYYAQNILSNITYSNASKTVTYDFIDTTGLANYFRLEVKKVNVNDRGTTICNSLSYSSAGSLTCNITGYDGDFTATGYISRSPEKVDKILSFIVDTDLIGNLGINAVFIVLILIITIVIAAAVISRGNPTSILFMLGITILGLKLINIFPFSWVITVTLEVLIIWMIFKIKS